MVSHFRPIETMRRRGFTLLEMITVLVVMGIVLAVALPEMDASGRTYLLQSGANKVMAALQSAQAEAISTGVSHGVTFSPTDNTLTCFTVTGSPPYPTINHPVKKTPYLVDFDTAPGMGGVAIASTGFPSDQVIFDSMGSPDSGGTVTVSLGVFQRNVVVAAISGVMEFKDP